jgi:hypothetical protein
MIVSHSHRFIFFHNPKCAGTSFRNALMPYHDDGFTFWGIFNSPYFKNDIDHTHLRLWDMHAQFPKIFACADRYNSIIFVRNPYDRFLSALNEHIKKFQPQVNLSKLSKDEIVHTAKYFIQDILSISRVTTDWRFIHFSPQTWYLKLGDRQIPRHIIPMYDDHACFLKALAVLGLPNLAIPHHNPSPVDLTAALESPIVTRFIQDFYAEDFDFFQSDRALAGLAGMPARVTAPALPA